MLALLHRYEKVSDSNRPVNEPLDPRWACSGFADQPTKLLALSKLDGAFLFARLRMSNLVDNINKDQNSLAASRLHLDHRHLQFVSECPHLNSIQLVFGCFVSQSYRHEAICALPQRKPTALVYLI